MKCAAVLLDSAFLPYRNHAAIAELSRLRRASGIALSDVASLAPQLTVRGEEICAAGIDGGELVFTGVEA